MFKPIRTAVAAAADEQMRSVLPRLLACIGVSLEEMAFDGASALEAAVRHRPDLLAMDVHLPVVDGIVLAERVLASGELPVRPRLLLVHRGEFLLPNRAKLEDRGAVFLSWPCEEAAVFAAFDRLCAANWRFSKARLARADELLDELGVPMQSGREAVKLAALLCAEDERLLYDRSGGLYSVIGESLSMKPPAVERAMRSAIGAAWRSDQFENQYRIFADTVDAGRGQPTCGEMIACLADILRLEG